MRGFFYLALISLGIFSWGYFLFLSLLMFTPSKLINSIDNYFLTTYSLEFSDIRNSGTFLNPSLKFYDFYLANHDKPFLISKELELGLFFQPYNLFQPLAINTLKIKDGYLKSFANFTKSSNQGNFINFKKEISLSFQNFKVENGFSSIAINGSVSGNIQNNSDATQTIGSAGSLVGDLELNGSDNAIISGSILGRFSVNQNASVTINSSADIQVPYHK